MNQILDYIVQNSAWFIGGVILIILAVIGYYADKTNFGQGKNASPEKQKTLDSSQTTLVNENKPLEKTEVEEIKNLNKESNLKNETEIFSDIQLKKEKEVKSENLIQQTDSNEKLEEPVKKNEEKSETVEFLDAVSNIVSKNEESNKPKIEEKIKETVEKSETVKETTKKAISTQTIKPAKPKKPRLTAEEIAFNKFEKEFESLLPKKETINADLLSDIDELELGKTQKIKLNEVPDLDDIDLPKIKNIMDEDQDIWKF